jgi:hypothetical protein
MLPSLSALIALQSVDTAAESSRRRLADLPKAEQALDAEIAAANVQVEAAKTKTQENQAARRALEKDVAAVDARLSRFDEHKAAVKTNQEYTALLHEIATARSDKDSLEERILGVMEEADCLASELSSAEAALAETKAETETARAAIAAERGAADSDLAKLAAQRAEHLPHVDARVLALYEQLLKGRRGVAVAQMTGETCAACHVRLRPHFTQTVRRNDAILQCESCQRILYYIVPTPPADAPASAP